jgi:hypothetical protein
MRCSRFNESGASCLVIADSKETPRSWLRRDTSKPWKKPSFRLVTEVESSFGSYLSVDIELHDVTGMLKIVRPLEVELRVVHAGGQAQCSARDGELQLIADDLQRDGRDL